MVLADMDLKITLICMFKKMVEMMGKIDEKKRIDHRNRIYKKT